MDKYKQLCVMPSTIVEPNQVTDFEEFIKEEFGIRVKFETTVKLNQLNQDDENKVDTLFYLHTDDIKKFAIRRLSTDIKWWEDYVDNGYTENYPEEILERYGAIHNS